MGTRHAPRLCGWRGVGACMQMVGKNKDDVRHKLAEDGGILRQDKCDH